LESEKILLVGIPTDTLDSRSTDVNLPNCFNALTRDDVGDSVALVVKCALGIQRLSPGED